MNDRGIHPLLALTGVAIVAACRFDVSGGVVAEDGDRIDAAIGPGDPDAAIEVDGATPDAAACEGLCGDDGTCTGGTCVYDCTAAAACPDEIVCPAGVPCRVECGGTSSCAGGVDCTGATACQVSCAGVNSCANEIECGGGACTVTCGGTGSCANGTTCTAACACDVDCAGAGSCADPAACPGVDGECDDGAGCATEPVDCRTCS